MKKCKHCEEEDAFEERFGCAPATFSHHRVSSGEKIAASKL